MTFSPEALDHAVHNANALAHDLRGPWVDVDDAATILAWLRWNDADGVWPDELADDVDGARAALVSVWAD
jgi:hypothetical protein